MIEMIPGTVTLATLEQIWRNGTAARLADSARAGVEAAAAMVAEAAAGEAPVYGINTGFGKLASTKIASEDTATLQRNLILSHSCGVGEPLAEDKVRLMMVLKLLSLGRGASGVRWLVINQIEDSCTFERGGYPFTQIFRFLKLAGLECLFQELTCLFLIQLGASNTSVVSGIS